MIEGNDLVFDNVNGYELLEPCVKALINKWPDAVFEYFCGEDFGECDELYLLPFVGMSEIFIYKNLELKTQWDNLNGSNEVDINSMLYFIARENDLTLVADDLNDKNIAEIIQVVKEVVNPTYCYGVDSL